MKRLAFVFAALGVVATAHAAEDAEFKHSGDFRARYENFMNPTGVKDNRDSYAQTSHRFRLNLNARKGEHIAVGATLLHTGTWGASGNSDSNGADYTNLAPKGSNGTKDGVTASNVPVFNQAWGWWKASDSMQFKVGRFGIEIGDGTLMSMNDTENTPTSHEGLMGMWDMDFAKVNFFAVKADELTGSAATATFSKSSDPEHNFYGLSMDFKGLPEVLKTANVHVIQQNRDEKYTSTTQLSLLRYGLNLSGEVAGLMFKADADMVGGSSKGGTSTATDKNVTSSAYTAMLGYGMKEMMDFKVGVTYHMDTGDKSSTDSDIQQYDSFYYDWASTGGMMDVIRWGNLNYISVDASIKPMDDMMFAARYTMFARSETGANSGPTTFNTAAYTNAGANTPLLGANYKKTEANLGAEIDISAEKTYEGGFKISLMAGQFMPGDSLKNGGTATTKADQSITKVQLEGTMTF